MARYNWTARLLYCGSPVAQAQAGTRRGVYVGEGGDLVVPGVCGRHPLALGEHVLEVPGLTRAQPGPRASGATRLRVDGFPEVEIEVERLPQVRNPFRRELLRAPLRELRYGMLLALALASLVTVKVAASPAQPEADAPDHDSELVRAMFAAVPVPVELAPARLRYAPSDVEPPAVDTHVGAPATGSRGSGALATTRDEETDRERVLVEQPDLSAPELPDKTPAKKRKRRKRGRRDETPTAEIAEVVGSNRVTMILGAYGGPNEGGVLDMLQSSDSSIADLLSQERSLQVGTATTEREPRPHGAGPQPAAARPTQHPVPEPGLARGSGPARGPQTDGSATADSVRPGQPPCVPTPNPKPHIDVVFVVDVSGGMGEALASLLTQIPALDHGIRSYDARPRYGVVAFVDRVQLHGTGTPITSMRVLEGVFEDLLSRAATNRQPSANAINAEATHNGLDALYAAATKFQWRDPDDTLRLIVYASDAKIGAAGETLSGTKVEHGYDAVVDTLRGGAIRVASFTNARSGAGFSNKLGGRPTIPSQTAGLALGLDGLVSHRLGLRKGLADLLGNPTCERALLNDAFGGSK